MSDDKIFKTLGEFVSYEEKEFGGVNKYIISYKQPNSQDPSKVWKHQAVEANLSDKAVELLVSASAGERLCVHQGKEGGYPLIVDLSDAKDVPAKSAGGGSKYNNKGAYVPRDDSGIAVGAAYTNAIEIIRMSGAITGTVDELITLVDDVAAKVLVKKLAQEGKLKAAKAAKDATTEKAAEAEKPKSRAQLAKEKKAAEKKEPEPEETIAELEDDDLDNVKF